VQGGPKKSVHERNLKKKTPKKEKKTGHLIVSNKSYQKLPTDLDFYAKFESKIKHINIASGY